MEKTNSYRRAYDLASGIAYMYLNSPDTKEREDALLRIMAHPCLSADARMFISHKIKKGSANIPDDEGYSFAAYQHYIMDEIIRNSAEFSELDFREKLYRELVSFLENPLCPFDEVDCAYGLWEDMDDYSYDYITELRGESL